MLIMLITHIIRVSHGRGLGIGALSPAGSLFSNSFCRRKNPLAPSQVHAPKGLVQWVRLVPRQVVLVPARLCPQGGIRKALCFQHDTAEHRQTGRGVLRS